MEEGVGVELALSGCLFLSALPAPNFSVSSFHVILPPCTILSRIVGRGVNSCWSLHCEVATFAWILHGLFLLSNWAFFFFNYSALSGGEICKYVFVLPAFPDVSLVFRRRWVCGPDLWDLSCLHTGPYSSGSALAAPCLFQALWVAFPHFFCVSQWPQQVRSCNPTMEKVREC